MLQQNPYERPTQVLKQKQALIDLNSLRKIMLHSRQKRFNNIIQLIDQIFDNPDKQFYPQSLATQLKYMKLFYNAINNEEISQNMNYQLFKDQKFKIMQLRINMKLKKGQQIKDDEIQQLVQIINSNPQFKQQAMMKTVGCKSIRRMAQITKQEIQDLTLDKVKQALKLQIVSDWKFIIGMQSQAITMKQLSRKLWENLNKMSRKLQTKQQFDQLVLVSKGKKVDSPYITKLKNIQKIVFKIEGIQAPISQNQKVEQRLSKIEKKQKQRLKKMKKKIAIRVMTKKMLQQMQIMVKQGQKDNIKSLTNSTLKKRGLIEQRREWGEKFIQQLQKNNYFYCQFIPENKFEYERAYQLQKSMGVIARVIKRNMRNGYQKLQKLLKKQQIKQSQLSLSKSKSKYEK